MPRRKPLNKSVGQEFVKGNLETITKGGEQKSIENSKQNSTAKNGKQSLIEQENNQTETTNKSTNKKEPAKKTTRKSKSKKELIDRFKNKDDDEKTIRITLDLKASLHRQLSQLSLDTGKSKADIIRQLLNELFE